ncbi:aspartate ammonia-lyase [Desulfovibrio inopinatus]|uniref:aspartate ammonia-lyase n=1 Tax=Desulfovibrio inopinatus TaxID=102109 RepID=UPI000A039DA2
MTDSLSKLRQFVLFAPLHEDDLAELAHFIEERHFTLGEYLFRSNTPRQECFFILSGEVEIVKGDYENRVLGRIGEGSVVGEGLILAEETHRNSCLAVVPTTALSIGKPGLETFFTERPEAARLILTQIVSLTTDRLQRAGNVATLGCATGLFGGKTRREHDLLGEKDVPSDAYFGIQTLRALENYHITGIPLFHFPNLIKALAYVKKAAAKANIKLKELDPDVGRAIIAACDEILEEKLHDHFVVDMIQGGAGTSTNMNANEVIANRALEILGHNRGHYDKLHPNTHVNMAQSTNDAYPTALRLAILLSYSELTEALSGLAYELKQKAVEFSDIIKMGRTQLQDAVPMTLGQEFDGFRVTIKEDIDRIRDAADLFCEVNLGATAIGTGINARSDYAGLAVEELARMTNLSLKPAENLVEATSDMGAFVAFSGMLKRLAVKLSKICNDLRLLSSGPRTGINEINLPPMAPGSSIMPGKVNPVIPEVVNQVAFQVIGNDIAITMAAEAGQLQLNVMEPLIAFNTFQSLTMLTRAVSTLTSRCISGITANADVCRASVERSIGIVTALNPAIGYENATRIAKNALETGRGVLELVLEEGLLDKEQVEDLLSPESMTKPRR